MGASIVEENLKAFIIFFTNKQLNRQLLNSYKEMFSKIQISDNDKFGWIEMYYQMTCVIYVTDEKKFEQAFIERLKDSKISQLKRDLGKINNFDMVLVVPPEMKNRRGFLVENLNMDIYGEDEFQIFPLDHQIQPTSLEIVKDPKNDIRLREFNVMNGYASTENDIDIVSTLPCLKNTDCTCRWLGFKKGDVIMANIFDLDAINSITFFQVV